VGPHPAAPTATVIIPTTVILAAAVINAANAVPTAAVIPAVHASLPPGRIIWLHPYIHASPNSTVPVSINPTV
jgi:hypothetical protein